MKKTIRIIAIIACLAVIVYEGVHIYLDQKEYSVAESLYESLEEAVMTDTPQTEDTPDIINYPVKNIDFEKLLAINEDTTAWLYFPLLDISYPVVKEKEINQYLYTTFEGTRNKAGCLFEDVLSDEDFCGMHDIIFGHNMKNGSMFGTLKKVYQEENKELLEQKPYIYVYTNDYVFEYRIFAYYITTVGSEAYTEVNTAEDYDGFLKYISTHSAYSMPDGLSFEGRPSILTLSTCSGKAGGRQRFVIHAVKVNYWERIK